MINNWVDFCFSITIVFIRSTIAQVMAGAINNVIPRLKKTTFGTRPKIMQIATIEASIATQKIKIVLRIIKKSFLTSWGMIEVLIA
jgi:hypothetical protein